MQRKENKNSPTPEIVKAKTLLRQLPYLEPGILDADSISPAIISSVRKFRISNAYDQIPWVARHLLPPQYP